MTHYQQLDNSTQSNLDIIFHDWLSNTQWSSAYFQVTDHTKVVDALKNDHFTPPAAFKQLVDMLISLPDPIEERLRKVSDYCFANRCSAERIDQYTRGYVTALPYERLKKNLAAQGLTDAAINNLLNKPPHKYNSSDIQFLLKPADQLIWLTWDEYDNSNPYACFSCNLTGNLVCDAMALPDSYYNQTMIAFYFEISAAAVTISKTTWIDSGMFDKWFPTNPAQETRWGLTRPLQPIPVDSGRADRRPEGIVFSKDLPLQYCVNNNLLY